MIRINCHICGRKMEAGICYHGATPIKSDLQNTQEALERTFKTLDETRAALAGGEK